MRLKTDYTDDVFTGSRKYQEILNDDNTKSFIDRTTYTRNGTRFGASDINTTNRAINKLYNPSEYTLNSGNWVSVSGGAYEYNLAVSGISSDDNVTVLKKLDSSNSNNLTNLKNYNKNFAYIVGGRTENGKIILVAYKRPSISLKIAVKGV